MTNNINILILDADGTQTLPLAKSLNEKNYIVHGLCRTKLSYGYHSRYLTFSNIAPSPLEESEYIEFLSDYIKRNNIKFLIPLSDDTASLLSKNKDRLLKQAFFKIPDYNSFLAGYNKKSLMTLCEKKGYPHPKTIVLPSTIGHDFSVEDNFFPALIKPNITCGGRGMTLVNSFDELISEYPSIHDAYGDCHLQQYILPGGPQVEVQLYIGDDNQLVNSSCIYKYRWYPEKGGSSCCCRSHVDKHIIDICYHLLLDLEWKGFADFDTIEDPKDGNLKIMELNPRMPACVKTAFISGTDWGEIIMNDYQNLSQSQYTVKTGLMLRFIGFEMLWFYYSKNRFRTKPNWFKFIGRNLYYQDCSSWDPLPFLYGTIGNVAKQLSPNFRKAKSGLRQ
ncbi:MAG: hypothetical protein LKF31_01995 [Muribaculaceae bacterium]|jgi:D-aspartate ligase|nr:hypothetical protein [Muribaculaceae bacterium]